MPPGPTLDGEARLEERERPGDGMRSSMQNPVALGAKRSASPVKGGIARAPACWQVLSRYVGLHVFAQTLDKFYGFYVYYLQEDMN